GLLVECHYAMILIYGHYAERARLLDRHFNTTDRDICISRDVSLKHRGVVHLVDMIAGEHENTSRAVSVYEIDVLKDCICRSGIPPPAPPLLRRPALHELIHLGRGERPPSLQMLNQRMRHVLCQHTDTANPGVQTVRQWKVDVAVLTSEW